MKIYLIRHGESTGDIEDKFGGTYNDNLTENGIAQARKLATQLKDKNIQIIFSSPLKRAKQTANEVHKALNIPIEIIENLKERNNYGVLSGLTKQEAKEKHPIDYEKIQKDKTHHNVTNSESYDQIKERVEETFTYILSKNYKTIAIISHGGIISTYVREFLTDGKNTKLGDCAILEIIKTNNETFELNCVYNAEIN